MTEPIIWTLKGFREHFRFVHTKMLDHAFAWVLGAGASRPSGIPTGGDLVGRWLREMHERLDTSGRPFEEWATADTLGIEGFSLDQAAAFYSRIYERRFRDHPDEGYAYLEELMAGKDPSPGYSILAKAIEDTRHRLVVTTNFDNLIADALSIYTDTFPFVVGHEALTGFVRAAMRRPLVCKIHRDLLLGPKSDPRSLKRLHETWAGALRSLFSHYTPIFVGYGGNDDSLMDLLESLDPGDIKGQLIWCYYENSTPSARIKELVVHHRGALVPVPDFDLFMILLGSVLGIEPLDSVIEERAKKRAENYRERVLALDTSGHPEVTAALSSTLERAGGWWAWDAQARREQDFDKREAIYRQGLHKFPKSFELHHNFASFLAASCGKAVEADSIMSRALALNPQSADLHVAHASLLLEYLRKNNEAETLFRRAMEIDPDNSYVLTKYADFIATHRGEVEKADNLFRRAIAIDSGSAIVHAHYGNFMASIKKDLPAADSIYQQALNLAPDSSPTVMAAAVFHSEYSGDATRAASLFERAMELNPKNHLAAANYAEFLITQRKFHEASTVVHLALKGKPENHSINIVLNTLGAIAGRSERLDDSQFLARIKTALTGKHLRNGWRLEPLERLIPELLDAEAAKFYMALLSAFRAGDVAPLNAFDRWQSIDAPSPKSA